MKQFTTGYTPLGSLQMDQITVAVLDCFAPAILDKLVNKIPKGWDMLAISEATFKERQAVIRKATATMLMGAPLDNQLLAEAPSLLYIQKLGAGVDNIDLDYCAEHKIGVGRLNAGNAVPVAEHTLMMMLAASRQLIKFDHHTRKGVWQKESARGSNKQINGKTIGIVGLGAIGRQVATLLGSFGVKILYCDPIPAPNQLEKTLELKRVTLDQLLRLSDIITLHCPLNTDTKHIINGEMIKLMKHGAIVINCARGGLIDETALANALITGQLFSAGLDTFSKEPPDTKTLLELQNTIVSPHCAGATLDNFDNIAERAIANIRSFLKNEKMPEHDMVYDPR